MLHYDPSIGVFTWVNPIGTKVKCGEIAGSRKEGGYLQIQVGGVRYQSQRLAWLYMYGELPVMDIDHIDGNPVNNRIENLRMATRQQNCCNRGKNKNNTSGFKGVFWVENSKKWKAQIYHVGRMIYLGVFGTPEEASYAYNRKALELNGEFYRRPLS